VTFSLKAFTTRPRLPDDPQREIRLGLIIAGAFFIGLLGWAAFVRVDAAVYAMGRIEVVGNRQSVQHPEGGVVGALRVKEGDVVRRGDVLLELATPQVIAEQQALGAQVMQLRALRARLIAERDGGPMLATVDSIATSPADRAEAAKVLAAQRQQYQARVAALTNQSDVLGRRKGQLREQIEGFSRQLAANAEQRRLIEEELVGVKSLAAKGYTPQTRVRELERAAASLDGANGEYRALVARAQEAIGENELQIVGLGRQRAEEVAESLRTVQAQLSDLEPRLQAARRRMEASQIRAPANGRVVGLTAFTVGGVIGAGQKVMDIVPQDAGLTIIVQVSPTDADDLRVGQATEVRFAGLHDRSLPQVIGKVVELSADSFADERTGQSFFRAEVRVPPEEWRKVDRVGQAGRIRPGLPVDVVIPLRKRSMLDYMVEPLRQSLWRSFREH
jgi:HlyD family type I secretion membrane fusion protein